MSAQIKSKSETPTAQVLAVGDIEKTFPERKVSSVAFSTLVRQLLQNWRQGTVGCKSRSEVARSGKKPWKQKGTGRARAGTARSPLWRGGGVTFGPQPRTRTLKVTKKLRSGVFNTLLWDALEQGNLICLEWTHDAKETKTAKAFGALKEAGLHDKKTVVLLPVDDTLHYASFVNIPSVRVMLFDEINAYDLSLADKWIVLKKDLDDFKKTVSKWI